MRTGDLLFVGIVLAVFCMGGVALIGSTPAPNSAPDTFGTMTTVNTNNTVNTATSVIAEESQGQGIFMILVAIVLVIVIIFGAMIAMKKGYGRGKYRTG